jgi:hypothetical protein
VETGTVFTGLGGWTDSFEYKWYYEDSEGNPTDIGAPVTFSGPGTKSFSCPVNNATPGTFDYYIEIINTYTYTPAGGAPVSRRAAKHIHVANVVVVTGTTYAVGETGPGGGTIFYVNPDGFTSNGVLCHYLEAGWLYLVSPATMQWSTSGTSVGAGAGGTAVGTGYANTQAILAALSGEPGMAAHRADAYAEGGQSDWFLPSRGELEAYYKEIHGSTNRLLWSSTESDSGRAWAVTYDNESQRVQSTTTAKTESLWVLPIRAF